MGVGLRSPRPKGYEAYGLCDAGTGGGVSEAEFEDQAGELVERIELLDGEERIAAACRGSANPAALQWIADTLSISSEHTVADLGAGLGGPAGWLRQQAGCDVIASDPSWPAVDGARRLFGLRAIQATADASPFGDDSCEGVLLLGVLSVVDDRCSVVDEARRIGRSIAVLDYCATSRDELPVGGSRFPSVDLLAAELASAWTGIQVARVDDPIPESWQRAAERVQAGVPKPQTERDVVDAIESGRLAPHALVARRS